MPLVVSLGSSGCHLDALLTPPERRPPADSTPPGTTPVILAFQVPPSDVTEGTIMSPAVEVVARDAQGTLVPTFTGAITLSLDPTSGALAGTRTQNPVNGVARYADLSVATAREGFRLTASAAGAAPVTSSPFNVTPRDEPPPPPPPQASVLAVVAGNGQSDTIGAVLSSPYVVRVTDDSGRPVAGVTVTWAVTGGGGTITPSGTVTNDAGQLSAVHTLGGAVGTHTVTASVPGASGSPVAFSATARHGAPASLAYRQQPTNTAPLVAIAPPVVLAVLDRLGHTATAFGGSLTAAIADGTGTPGATLSGTLTQPAVNGVATFPDLSVNLVGVGYHLRMVTGTVAATSAAFDVLVASPSPASLERESGTGQVDTAGATLGNPYVVRVRDGNGIPVSGVRVTWAVASGGGSVVPATSVTDADGRAAAVHTLGASLGTQAVRASAEDLNGSPATFTSTATHGAPVGMVFQTQPTNAAPLTVISPPVRVAVVDRQGHVASRYEGVVAMTITPGTGTPGASLAGTRSRAAVNGVAAFDDLSISLIGLGYRLRSAAAEFVQDSAPFDVLLP
ncbi:MAG TPA: Ig-like domain-containing protein [Gemmatimonadales bacterium]|nr:Ig-like domain-containing protein [Gemmatimonadales bacterium]